MSTTTKIPRRIFQTWKTHTLTDTLMCWQNTWKTLNPTYEYELWDDEDNLKFVEAFFPEMLETYNSFPRGIYRADAIRYMYLYTFGGIYADLDFICLKPFEPILNYAEQNGVDIVFGTLGEMTCEKYDLHSIPNALMISTPKADFWRFVLDSMLKPTITDSDPEIRTGPIFLKICMDVYTHNEHRPLHKQLYGCDLTPAPAVRTSKITITDKDIFYPINWDSEDDKKKASYDPVELAKNCPQSYAATIWMHSW